MRSQGASSIEPFLVGLQIHQQLIDLLRIADPIQPGQTDRGKDLVSFAMVEILFPAELD